ncbi:radial spoke head protein 3 homolog [Erinaceus europaeus]|uniref:Radial spoke head protein 3 homolog n=1 Tax=Erinaceus europaeus TaxID=9365 RepID=A0ABM3YJ61_ERIEU|nr:radial spoke head protein 3 homolog [Erinaceus europaeus]
MSTYNYTSRPRALPCQRRRYRHDLLQPPDEPMHHGNIMYDRRVIRGNTYALQMGPPPVQSDALEFQRLQQSHKKAAAKRRALDQFRPQSPEAVEGRKHLSVQTGAWPSPGSHLNQRLEERDLTQNGWKVCLRVARHPPGIRHPEGPRPAIPACPGPPRPDPNAGRPLGVSPQLFDFDLEVKPMLEVLVGKTIEQALLEVMEEEELASLQVRQYNYEELRNAELAEVQRLEEQERRHREEKERRKQQQWEIVHKQTETSQKIAARVFAQRYLSDLLPSVFGSLRDAGYFYDPVERDIEVGFLPWLLNEVDKAMEHSMLGRAVLDMLIREVVQRRQAAYEALMGRQAFLAPETGFMAPTTMVYPPEVDGPQDLLTPGTQGLLLDRDLLQTTQSRLSVGRPVDSTSLQDGLYMEEEGEEPFEIGGP